MNAIVEILVTITILITTVVKTLKTIYVFTILIGEYL